jgi:flagellin FlaB
MGKWMKSLKRFARNKKAISGLETAIVLIAFVIVASAFAYAVLNMGFLATQKSQQVVLGGLSAASSALVVDGPVYGYSSQCTASSCPVTSQLTTIIFWLKTASGASAVDLNPGKTTISFQNPRGVWPNVYFCSDGTGVQAGACVGTDSSNAAITTATQIVSFSVSGSGTTSYYNVETGATNIVWEVGSGMLLQSNQKVRVTIDLSQIGYGTSATTTPTSEGLVNKNDPFTIIVKPPSGSVLDIERTAPAAVESVNNLG